jgi:hypothetical protein
VLSRHNDHPDPYIPAEALERPAGAAVHRGNQVACVTCQTMIPLAKADVVGMGYRCQPCSQRAELALLTGGGDAAAHFSSAERKSLSESGLYLIYGGGLVLLLGMVLIGFLFFRWGIAVMIGGGVMMGTGLSRRNAAH